MTFGTGPMAASASAWGVCGPARKLAVDRAGDTVASPGQFPGWAELAAEVSVPEDFARARVGAATA